MSNRDESIILKKAFNFGVRIVKLCYGLNTEKEFILSRQLMRSGTSIGANINEALAGYSRRDFQYKMMVALKEAQETEYWLKLLHESELFKIDFDDYLNDIREIQKILTAIIKTSKSNGSSSVKGSS